MLNKRIKIKTKTRNIVTALLICLFFTINSTTVYADTDGNELRTTLQPDKLILQMGSEMADSQFELKLDTGVFPSPVTANSSGTLTMELGGSSSYTLTRLDMDSTKENQVEQSRESTNLQNSERNTMEDFDPILMAPAEVTLRIPRAPLFIFLGGLGIITIGLIISKIIKRRREQAYENQDEYDE